MTDEVMQIKSLRKMQDAGIVTRTRFEIPKGTTLERCQSLFKYIESIDNSLQWWIGDILAFSSKEFGENELMQMLDPHSTKHKTYLNYMYVSLNVEPARRRAGLSFSHHDAVKGLDIENQDKFLMLAEKETLSVSKLRDKVSGKRNEQKEKQYKEKLEDMPRDELIEVALIQKRKIEKKEKREENINDLLEKEKKEKKELKIENNQLKKKLEQKDEIIQKLRDEIKGNQPTLNTRPYTEYWNEKNKEYFGHMMFECKGKEGKIISRWPTPEIMALRNIVGRLGEKTYSFIDYIYTDEFWRDKTQPSRVGSTKTMDMILKQRKGKKKKREKFDMDYSQEERPSKEESEAFINKLKKNRTKK